MHPRAACLNAPRLRRAPLCPTAPQVQFNADLRVINECLDGLIQNAQETRQEEDSEALQNRDYSKVGGPVPVG